PAHAISSRFPAPESGVPGREPGGPDIWSDAFPGAIGGAAADLVGGTQGAGPISGVPDAVAVHPVARHVVLHHFRNPGRRGAVLADVVYVDFFRALDHHPVGAADRPGHSGDA